MPARRCAVCKREIPGEPLALEQDGERVPLCSFECVINHAVQRIRERRKRHNTQVAQLQRELRRSLGDRAKSRQRD